MTPASHTSRTGCWRSGTGRSWRKGPPRSGSVYAFVRFDRPSFVSDGLLHLREGPIKILEVRALRRRIDRLDLDHRANALEERDLDVDQREELLLIHHVN